MASILKQNLLNTFIVQLYNKSVLRACKDNQDHPLFDDRWADEHKIPIVAATAHKAIALAQERFPRDEGFVITRVSQATSD